MVKYQTCLIRTVGRLYGQLADDYGPSADDDIPTVVSALESADSELESADSSADSNPDSAEVGVWEWALKPQMSSGTTLYIQKTHSNQFH